MLHKESIPFAPTLIESMRSLGYSFESAIADLIDNSVSASAKKIDIFFQSAINPYLIIIDDGCGMSPKELEEAMRYGSRNPLEQRMENDLGRFGLGLKSASLSQCRELIVISKKNNCLSCFSWNIDYVIENGAWYLIQYNINEINQLPYFDEINQKANGTYVLLREFDRVAASSIS